jgi:hypothetical protein
MGHGRLVGHAVVTASQRRLIGVALPLPTDESRRL